MHLGCQDTDFKLDHGGPGETHVTTTAQMATEMHDIRFGCSTNSTWKRGWVVTATIKSAAGAAAAAAPIKNAAAVCKMKLSVSKMEQQTLSRLG